MTLIGRLINSNLEHFPFRDVLLAKGVQNQPECMQCAYALICGGDCGSANRAQTGNIFNTACVERKDLMTEAIKEVYFNKCSLTTAEQELIASQLAHPNL